jgi:APA family basic amino acid/polyamine antiporter
MVAYAKHPNYSLLRHGIIPVFGMLANLACMGASISWSIHGLRHQDGAALLALGIAFAWAIYGALDISLSIGKTHGKTDCLAARPYSAA